MLLLHGDNVDLGPGLQDGQLLERECALVVDDGRLPERVVAVVHLRVQLAERRDEKLPQK